MRIPAPIVKRRPRIEIIPLIDIVFFLLATFVMVSMSMVKNQGIAVNLPQAATSANQDVKDIVTITVNEKGDVFVEKEKMGIEQMSQQLRLLKANNPDIKILINGDDKADFGKAIAVLDEVRNLGITKVSIRTKTKS